MKTRFPGITTSLIILAWTLIQPLEAADQLRSQISFGSTTDKIDYYDLEVTGVKNERDLTWPYLNELNEDQIIKVDAYRRHQKGQNFSFNYTELNTQYSKVIDNKYRLSAHAGLYHIDEDENKGGPGKRLKTAAGLSALLIPTKNLLANISIQRGSAARSIFLTGPNLDALTATTIDTRVQYQFYKQLFSVKADVIKHFLRDSVERTYFDAELMASLMKYPHWVRVGFGYHTLDFNKSVTNYWSPTDFYAYGPRVDLSYVFNNKMQIYLGGNYSWFEENQTFKGSGYYMRGGGRYGIREDFTVDLSYERNESVQNNSSWVANSYFFNMTYFL